MTLVQKEVKNMYIGEYKKPIVCDFTQSDCGFTFSSAHSSVTHGRDSTYGLYGYNSASSYKACAWLIPSDIRSKGMAKKIIFKLYASKAGCGGGISYSLDSRYSRVWWQGNMKDRTGTYTITALDNGTPATTEYTFTIDLENKEQYINLEPTKIQTLTDTDVTNITNYWTAGTLGIVAMCINQSGTYFGIKSATFYF